MAARVGRISTGAIAAEVLVGVFVPGLVRSFASAPRRFSRLDRTTELDGLLDAMLRNGVAPARAIEEALVVAFWGIRKRPSARQPMAQNGTRCRPLYEARDARISIVARAARPETGYVDADCSDALSRKRLRTGRALGLFNCCRFGA